MKSFLLTSVMLASICITTAYADFHDWAPTPPMGWNSWDCYGSSINEAQVRANADWQAEHLLKYGYDTCVVDIRWTIQNEKYTGYNQEDPIYTLDEWGRYIPAPNRFPSSVGGKGFKPLADYIHSKGLKFGIHIMRGVPKEAVRRRLPIKDANGATCDQISNGKIDCAWLRDNCTIKKCRCLAPQKYYDSIIDLYAEWGVDFIKCDDLSAPTYHTCDIEWLRRAIDRNGRKIVLSTSPGETPISQAAHLNKHANMWRMVNDVWDTWQHIAHLVPIACEWIKQPHVQGSWPDCDMIPLGKLGVAGHYWSAPDKAGRPCKLNRYEQQTLMHFFAICRSPLFIGADLPQLANDKETFALLTDPDTLAAQRDGRNPQPLFCDNEKCAIVSENVNGGKFLALFNLKNESATLQVLGVKKVLPAHGSALIRLP